ncbi:hypothetical protein KI387_029323, partial [Taxus chinensis]
MRSGNRIPSLEAGQDMVIGKSRSRGRAVITLNGRARVVFPDLYADSNVVVHGIDRVLGVDLHSKGCRRKTNKNSRIADLSSRSGNHILPFSHSLPFRVLGDLRMQRDSNAGPGGSKGHSTLISPTQARRSEVP